MTTTADLAGSARVIAVREDGAHTARVVVETSDEIRALHERPGQYVMWQPEGAPKAWPMALANAPGAPFELFVKDAARRFPEVGARAHVGAPKGPGFPIDTLEGRALLLVGTGSGVAPLIAVLRALVDDTRGATRVALLYGEKTAQDLAFADERARFQAAGFDVVTTLSRDDDATHARGRVMAHLPAWLDGDTTVFVCGQGTMMDEITRAVVERGVDASRVHRNF